MGIFRLVIISVFFLPLSGICEKVITSDFALYRVENKIQFFSQFNDFRKSLDIFRCFKSKMLLLPALNLDIANLKKLPSISDIKKLDKNTKFFIKKIILLEKALIHIEKQGRKFDKKSFSYFEDHECVNRPFRNWPKLLQELVTVEIYFQERFIKKKAYGFHPQTWKNVKLYLLSLDKKIFHYVFF